MCVFCKKKKSQKNNTLFKSRFVTECFCYYIHLFSTCKVFRPFISPISTCKSFGHLHYPMQSKERSWRQLCRSRLILRMMQSILFKVRRIYKKEVVALYCQVQSFLCLIWGSLICIQAYRELLPLLSKQ